MAQRIDSPLKIFSVVLAIAFGVVALAVSYVAVKNTADTRSHASVGNMQTYLAWEFTKGQEGWVIPGAQKIMPKGGYISLLADQKTELQSPAFSVTMPQGNKSIVFRMSATGRQFRPYRMSGTSCTSSPDGDVACPVSNTIQVNPGYAPLQESVKGDSTEGSSGVVQSGPLDTAVTQTYPIDPLRDPSTYPCQPKPVCLTGERCAMPEIYPLGGWCEGTPTPAPTCTPRPPCMDEPGSAERCMMGKLAAGSWYCPPGGPISTPEPQKRFMTLSIRYNTNDSRGGKNEDRESSKGRWMTPSRVLIQRVPLDGTMADYVVTIPDIGAITINQLSIRVDSGAARGDMLVIDYIRLMGPIPVPTVKPTCVPAPRCNVGLARGQDGKYRCPTLDLKPGVNYCDYPTPNCVQKPTCAMEGTVGKDGRRTYCQFDAKPGVVYCAPTPPVKTPPAGCYYQQVKCIKAPCPEQLICQQTKPPVVVKPDWCGMAKSIPGITTWPDYQKQCL